MKKLLFVITMLSLSPMAFAQDIPLVDFGLKAGVNSTWLRGLPLGFDGDGNRSGFVGGAWARFNVPGIGLFAQPELVISQSGGSYTIDGSAGSSEIRMTSLDIPIILGKRIGIGPLGLRIGAGPVFSSILSAKLENSVDGELDLKDVDLVNNLQLHLQAGIGVDISKLAVDVRYIHSFSSIFDESILLTNDQGQPVGDIQDIKVSGFQVTLGYKLF